jgi:arylsulfatase A-like enzyme
MSVEASWDWRGGALRFVWRAISVVALRQAVARAHQVGAIQIGRVLDAVQESGQLDNTLVIFIMGDNGASAEGTMQGTTNEVATAANGVQESLPYLLSMMDQLGGPLTYNHYPVGWAHAMDAPMQWTTQVASHFGGTRNGMVISWPARIKDKGGIRPQCCRVIDIVPTIYEAARITPPTMMGGVKQKPLEGVSVVYSFDNANAPTRHTAQYLHDGDSAKLGCGL